MSNDSHPQPWGWPIVTTTHDDNEAVPRLVDAMRAAAREELDHFGRAERMKPSPAWTVIITPEAADLDTATAEFREWLAAQRDGPVPCRRVLSS